MKRLTLKAAREKRKWRRAQVARLSGLAKTTVNRIESGFTANPSYDTVVALEKALELERGTLVFGSPARESASV